MDAVKYLFEDKIFPDELPVAGTAGDTYDTLQHIYEHNQPETFRLLKSWADLVAQRVIEDGRKRWPTYLTYLDFLLDVEFKELYTYVIRWFKIF